MLFRGYPGMMVLMFLVGNIVILGDLQAEISLPRDKNGAYGLTGLDSYLYVCM